jgi:hypothetical protein
MTLRIGDTQHRRHSTNNILHYAECHYVEYYIIFIMLNVILLSVDMLNVVMLNVDMLNVVMLSIAMLSVAAPLERPARGKHSGQGILNGGSITVP